MVRRTDPFALFPVAVGGIVLGLLVIGGCGYLAFDQATTREPTGRASTYAQIEGRVAWAGWRTSAARGGADRFLQIWFENDPRGFLVAVKDLPDAVRKRLEESRSRDDEVPALVGRTATVAVDSALLGEERPYISGLQVGEEPIIPVGRASSDSSQGCGQRALRYLYWTGILFGVVLLSASVQHVVVCVRYGRRRAD